YRLSAGRGPASTASLRRGPVSLARWRTPGRRPGSGEVAVAGDKERHDEVETDLNPGLPPRVTGGDPWALIDRRQNTTNHRSDRQGCPQCGPVSEQAHRFARP